MKTTPNIVATVIMLLSFGIAYAAPMPTKYFLYEVETCTLDKVEEGISGGVDIEASDDFHKQKTPLMLAVENNCTAVVKRLVAEGADVNTMDKDGFSVLYIAVSNIKLNKDIAYSLIQHNANVNFVDRNGYSVLMMATYQCNVSAVLHLAGSGKVDVNFKKKEWMQDAITALSIARSRSQSVYHICEDVGDWDKIITALKKAGATE